MMKSWRRLCVLVLAISSMSRGHNHTLTTRSPTPTPPPVGETKKEAPLPTPQRDTSATATVSTTQETARSTDGVTTERVDGSSGPPTTASLNVSRNGEESVDVAAGTVSTATGGTTPEPATSTRSIIENSGHSSWAYVILVFIILVIIVLCVILYFLRRVSRTYSFDLQRPVAANHHNEPTGTFEAVYLDDLDRQAPTDQVTDDLSPPAVANGTSLQSEEKGSNGENAPQEQPDANGLEASPTSNNSLSLGSDPADKTSSPMSLTDLLFDAIGKEQQNENNNNPSVCSSDPFVEISLDDPAWCDLPLTSPEATSSVLPFSPFSFSSS